MAKKKTSAPKPSAPKASSDVDGDLVRKLSKLLEETGLTEIEYGRDGWYMRVAKGSRIAAPIPAVSPAASAGASRGEPAADAPEDDLSGHPGAVASPMVGVIYHAPEPGAAPFVRVGDQVKPGQTLFLIEAMKVMNPVAATAAGRVARILVANGAPVEYGEVLALIE